MDGPAMKTAAVVLAAIGAALAAFGWWGVNTLAGQHRFDEMDGIIPAAAGFFGVVLLAVASGIALLAWWRSRRAAAGR
jgi:hypothetical protein